MVAQCRAFVVAAEEAAALQFRHDQVYKIGECAREMTGWRRNSSPHRDPEMAAISASSLLLRVSATVRSLIPLRTLRAVDGTGSPCPLTDLLTFQYWNAAVYGT